MVRILMALCVVLLAGCSGTIGGVCMKSPEELKAEPTPNVAAAYGYASRFIGDDKKLRAELKRRNAFTPEQWDRIDRKKIVIGDPVELVYASWGSPTSVRNWTTEYSGGQEFEYYHVDRSNFVYIRDGRVAAVDN